MNSADKIYGVNVAALKVFSGYYKSKEELHTVASGGLATAISRRIICKGGVVFGVAYSADFRTAEYVCAECESDLERLKSSKYIVPIKQCKINGEKVPVYAAVKRKLEKGIAVAFFGSGCDVAYLLDYLNNKKCPTENLFTIDMICHGPTYPEVLDQYVGNIERRYHSRVVALNMRHKVKGSKPAYICAELANGKIYKRRLYESDFGYAFLEYKKLECYSCKFKGDNHKADLTIGDYWGCTKEMKEFNPFGVSVMFSRSTKGEELLNDLALNDNEFIMNSADMKIAIHNNPAFYKVTPRNIERYNQFKEAIRSQGLHYSVIHSSGYHYYIKSAIKKRIKALKQR